MLCSIANDPSGDVYKIISITWDGSCKECYLKKRSKGREHVPKVERDVLEQELVPPAAPRELTPPPSEREWSPPPSELGSNRGGPIQIVGHGVGSGPAAYPGGYENRGNGFSSPKAAYVEEYREGEEDDTSEYDSKPPLSPAMAERGIFPADEEEWYGSQNGTYNGQREGYGKEDEYYGGQNEEYGGESQGFITLGQHESRGREVDLSTSKSDKRSHGKKHKRHHREKSEKDKGGEKSKSKSRSRRSSASSSKRDEKKEEKRDSSHRGRREKRKPSLFGF